MFLALILTAAGYFLSKMQKSGAQSEKFEASSVEWEKKLSVVDSDDDDKNFGINGTWVKILEQFYIF